MAERNQSKALEAQRLRRAAELERRTKRQLGAIISAVFRVFFFISFYGSPLFLVCCLTWFVRCFCLWVKERAHSGILSIGCSTDFWDSKSRFDAENGALRMQLGHSG